MQKYSKTVCVVGLGYIGLPTAALLACKGYDVCGVDIDANVVNTINDGGIHIVEPELGLYVKKAIETESLKAYSEPQAADIYMICVPTPFYADKELPTPNLEYVLKATESIAHLIKAGDIVILESTSPVGTTDKIRDILSAKAVNVKEISIAYCPERVLPGKIMVELISNDRIIGGIDEEATRKVSKFYNTFVDGDVLTCSAKTAEMCKLAENSFRDVNIAFANELSMVCDTHDINPWEVIRLANHHPRVNILQPGTGVGGHCIAVDPWFIVSGDYENARIIKQARQVNDSKPIWVASKIAEQVKALIAEGIKHPVIACLGLAFKPDIDDLRESPAVSVVQDLLDLGHDVVVVEPNITEHKFFRLSTFDDALGADLVVVLVNHTIFSSSVNRKRLLEAKALDFCGLLAQERASGSSI
jgi:UDP-N-acetyl-D-mannosaminuronic acid dehydrogenase